MNKAELVEAVAKEANLSKKDAEKAITAFVETVGEEVSNGGKVNLPGFGTFEVSERAEKTGHNPKTGDKVLIPAHKTPKFKPSKKFKEEVNNR